LERLGDYEGAVAAFEGVGPDASPEISAAARQSLGRLRELRSAARRQGDPSSLESFLAHLRRKSEELEALASKFEGTPYEALARIEAEQADLRRVLLMFHCRHVLPDGLNASLAAGAELVRRHSESRLARRHALLLADFYFTAAKDYAALHDPERAGFVMEDFEPLAVAARELYFDVAQEDGTPEKPEARAKWRAVEAFVRAVEARGGS
jgi:hypothetical protein